jgi:AGAO-like protein
MTNLLGGPSPSALCRTIVASLIGLYGACASGAAHPVDSLSREEIAATVAVLREAGHIDAAARFALIDLDEPRKADVLAWKPADPFIRKAFIRRPARPHCLRSGGRSGRTQGRALASNTQRSERTCG